MPFGDDCGSLGCVKDFFPLGLLVVATACVFDSFLMLGIGVGDRFRLLSSPFGFWGAVCFATGGIN